MSRMPESSAGDKIARIEGTVTLVDGSTHEFSISPSGRQSWGATQSVVGWTAEPLDAFTGMLVDDGWLADDDSEAEYEAELEQTRGPQEVEYTDVVYDDQGNRL